MGNWYEGFSEIPGRYESLLEMAVKRRAMREAHQTILPYLQTLDIISDLAADMAKAGIATELIIKALNKGE